MFSMRSRLYLGICTDVHGEISAPPRTHALAEEARQYEWPHILGGECGTYYSIWVAFENPFSIHGRAQRKAGKYLEYGLSKAQMRETGELTHSPVRFTDPRPVSGHASAQQLTYLPPTR